MSQNPRCQCWVAQLSPPLCFATRRGAHALDCPVYRPSLDHVDALKDKELRERFERVKNGNDP